MSSRDSNEISKALLTLYDLKEKENNLDQEVKNGLSRVFSRYKLPTQKPQNLAPVISQILEMPRVRFEEKQMIGGQRVGVIRINC